MSKGYVYILTNEHMPGLVKIGRTTGEPALRAQQLFQTGVPGPFVVADQVLSPDCVELEETMHENFAHCRVDTGREFFRAGASEVSNILHSELKAQVNVWVEDFLPDHLIVGVDESVSPERMELISCELEMPMHYVAAVLSEVTTRELLPALQRVADRYKAYKADREKGAQQ